MIKVFDSESSEHEIKYPTTQSDFEVQAWLYCELLNAGINVRGEVSKYGGFGLRDAKATCRFDLVVFGADKKAEFIIEVKPENRTHKTVVEDTRQCKRYRKFGVPLYYAYGMEGAKEIMRKINNKPNRGP